MLYVLIVAYMIILPLTLILLLVKILDIVEDISKNKFTKTENKSVLARRKHTNIGPSNYSNVFNKRNAYNYDKYKNNEGLYQPVTPHKPGVKIQKKED